MENQTQVNNQANANVEGLKSAKPTFWDRVKAHKGAAIGVAVGVGAALVAAIAHGMTARQDDSGMIEDISEESNDEE